jgi:hypothetical protein
LNSNLYLDSEVRIEVASSARPFNIVTDGSPNDIDPKQQVYNIRGSFAQYQCSTPNAGGGGTYPIGKNCTRRDFPKFVGMCYKDTFGDWHCVFQNGLPSQTVSDQPAPKD